MENREFFNSIAEKWDRMSFNPIEKINYVFSKMNIKEGDQVLDIGSGTGIIIPYIEKKIGPYGKVTALDVSEKMIEISKEKNHFSNLEFVISDFMSYKKEEKYDYIVAYSCYPHFNDTDKFFKSANLLLRKGGEIAILHIESRDKINNRHNLIEKEINSNKLEKVENTRDKMISYGFDAIYCEDTNEYYICIGKKI